MHPSRAVFHHLARMLGTEEVELYTTYLAKGMDIRIDFRELGEASTTDPEIAANLFGYPGNAPRFYNFASYIDCARLQNCLPDGIYLRIYRAASSNSEAMKIFDNSQLEAIRDGGAARDVSKSPVLVYDPLDKSIEIQFSFEPSDYSPLFAEYEFSRCMSEGKTEAMQALTEIFDDEEESFGALDNYSSVYQLLVSPGRAREHLKRPLWICYQKGCRTEQLGKTVKDHFQPLCLGALNPADEKCQKLAPRLVFLTHNTFNQKFYAYEPQPWLVSVAMEKMSAPRKSAPGGNEPLMNPAQIKIDSLTNKLAFVNEREKNETADKEEKEELGGEDSGGNDATACKNKEGERKTLKCACRVCTEADERYGRNISADGPQTRWHIPLTGAKLLHACGIDSKSNLESLSSACVKSIAAMDIEAITRIDETLELADIVFKAVSEQKVSCGVVGEQITTLLGLSWNFEGVDTMRYSSKIFDVGSNPKQQLLEFAKELIDLRESAEREKRLLLADIFDSVAEFKKVHMDFFKSRGCEEKEAERVFSAGHFGRLFAHCESLCKDFYVFSLNGSGYDHVIMGKPFRAVLKNSLGIAMGTAGGKDSPSRHTKLHFRCPKDRGGGKVSLSCLSQLVGPGCSLASLAKAVGLKEEKHIFPFSYIRSHEMLDLPQLPTAESDWFDYLNQQAASPDKIAKAHKLFQSCGAKSIKEYLRVYLERDIQLTLASVCLFMEQLNTSFQVHPIDSKKLTIASYSSFASLQVLVKDRRPTPYSNTCLPDYHVASSSKIGGICLAAKHVASENFLPGKSASGKTEEFLRPPTRAEAKTAVATYDIASLYGTSTKYPLPYGPSHYLHEVFPQRSKNRCFARKLPEQEKCLNAYARMEIAWCQQIAKSDDEASLVFSSAHAGPGQVCFGSSAHRRVDLFIVAPGGIWKIHQYHESSAHKNVGHDETCPKYEGVANTYDRDTVQSDEFNKAYADYLTEHTHLKVSYEVHSECGYKHVSPNLLDKMDGNKDYVLMPRWLRKQETFTEEELLRLILQKDSPVGGFVVLEGGREEIDDACSRTTGFCLQRSRPTPEELGPQALKAVLQNCPASVVDKRAWAKKRLEEKCKQPVTMLRKSFSPGLHYLSMRHFVFLYKERRLRGFKIRGVMHIEERDYLREFVEYCLQKRHDIGRAGLKGSLECMVLKLVLNASYGFYMIENSSFPKSSFVSENSLLRYEKRRNSEGKKSNLLSLALWGTTVVKNKTELVYLVRRSQEDASIRNMMATGCTILGQSRVIFYSILMFLLNCADETRMDFLYADTDSYFLQFRDATTLREVVLPEKLEEFDAKSPQIFEDSASPVTQGGKIKLEGTYARAYIRGVKTYYLQSFADDTSNLAKAKGIPKRIVNQMEAAEFSTAECKNYYQNMAIAPAPGGGINLVVRARRAIVPLNTKRRVAEDGSNTFPLE